MSISVATLQSYRDTEHVVSLHCDACRHHVDIDLPKAIERFGPQYDLVENRLDFLSRFHCSRCGSKNLSIRVRYANAGKKSEAANGGGD